MATEKPRITITLEPDEYAVLHRLAKLQGSSMSRILREFMGEVTPILSKVADSLEVAQRASEGAKANLRRAAEAAEEEVTRAMPGKLRAPGEGSERVSAYEMDSACSGTAVGLGERTEAVVRA